MRRFLPITLLLTLIATCGPSATPPPKRGAAAARRAARRAAPKKCPTLELSPKLRRHKKITRRIRKEVCGLQACYDAAQGDVKDLGDTVRLSVTIDPEGRVEAVRLSAREVTASLTRCVRSKVMAWDFDIRDAPFTYGPFKIRFAP